MAETPQGVSGEAGRSPPGRFVAPLDAFGADDLARAGGKAANLGELLRAGYRVPSGFVVTTDAYAAVAEHTGLASQITAGPQQELPGAPEASAGAAIREQITEADVPEAVRAAIVEAYTAAGLGPVAVRSSATAEDLAGAAFAGQQDTYLNVAGADAVVDAVRRCWASLWTDRAIAYRRKRGIDPAGVRIAVVVQAMVDADAAGVMLTANPVTGARDETVVDSSSGLGEAVVSGMVTPDHYVLNAQGAVREWTPGRREVVVRASADGGTTHAQASEADAQGLPEAVLAELARLGDSVSGLFGRPQDIEWAYAAGRVWLLQARPLTALPPPPLRLSRMQRITGPQVIEMLPVRPYPLDMSAWLVPGLGRMVARMLDEIPGLRVDLAEALPEQGGVVDRFVPPVPRLTRRVVTAPVRNIGRLRRCDPAAWTQDPRFADFEQRVSELAGRDPATLPWEELRRVPRQALEALDVITDLRVDYLPRAAASLLRLRLVLLLLGQSDLFGSLLVGAPTRTGDANRALAALGARVRADEALRERFATLAADELADELERAPEAADFRQALHEFLAEYGHRETASPLLVSSPTWADAPAAVLGAVSALARQDAEAAVTERSGEAMARLLGHPLARRLGLGRRLALAVEAARAGVAFREDTHFHGTRALPIVRRCLLEMGHRLARAGILADRDEVFHLRLEELEALPDPSALAGVDAERVRRAVAQRSARREELSGVPLISSAVLFPGRGDDAEALVVGAGAGGGQATGRVRVIREAAEFGRLRSGDVLVCPYTNPAWTPLFQRAVAVVVDTGGTASHAAIVAREYQIPAVMGTGTGTTVLTDGQLVRVDGDRGRVTGADGA